MAGLTPVHLNVGARDLFLSDVRRLRDALHKRRRHRHLHRAVGRQAHLLAANPHRQSPVDHGPAGSGADPTGWRPISPSAGGVRCVMPVADVYQCIPRQLAALGRLDVVFIAAAP